MKLLMMILGAAVSVGAFAAQAPVTAYKCDVTSPRLSAPKIESCKDLVTWGYELDEIRKTDVKLFEQKVMEQISKGTNVGSAVFNFPDGSKKAVYRSSFLTDAPECIRDLVKDGGVRSIINLYNKGDLAAHDTLSTKEKGMFQKEGGSTYINILNYEYKFKDIKKEKVIDKLAEIISVVRLAPGNLLLHCFGGMHRTGLVFGVMQKCFNKLPIEKVIEEYRCHVAYENEARQGGRHEENEEVLRDFPCEKVTGKKGRK